MRAHTGQPRASAGWSRRRSRPWCDCIGRWTPSFRWRRGAGAAREAILLHATARPEKEWRVPDWIALAKALAARGYRPVLPWGTEPEQRRSVEIASAVPDAIVPERHALDVVAQMIARAALVVG